MNILRKSRKSTIKLDKRKVVLLIFTLIMTTFAWITYSKILLPTLKLHINSWNISIYVDDNKNGVAEEEELADKTAPIVIQPFEVYPGMNQDIMNVIIKNNGETPADIAYIISGIKFLGNDYSIKQDAAAHRISHPEEFCLQENTYENYGGIVTYKLINEESMIPFEFIIEHTQVIDGGAEGYLKVKAVWDATLDEGATEEQIDAKNEFDGKWGFDLTKYAETTGAAIGQPRSGRFVLTQDITPENYGDYVDYSVDLNGDGNTKNDWRIFFEDNENIYLISANYVLNSWLNENAMEKATDPGKEIYGARFSEENLSDNPIDKTIINKFYATSMVASDNTNYKSCEKLLNTSYWTQFVDTNVAVMATGGPSIEMFAKSWNQKYNGDANYSELKVNWDVNKESYNILIDNQKNRKINGSEDASLYFPTESNDETEAYWLVAPTHIIERETEEENSRMWGIKKDGYIGYGGCTTVVGGGVRPVVCLKSGIFGEVTEISPGNRVWTLTTVHPNDREEAANVVGNEVVEE